MTPVVRSTMRRAVAAGFVLAAGLAAAPLFAQGPPGPRFRGSLPGWGPGDPAFGLRGLDLSDGQREQVRGILNARQQELRAVGDRLREARQGMDALVTADTVDEAAIRAKSAELAAVQAEAALLRARLHQELFSVLTAEQQARARQLRADREARLKERADRFRERRQARRPVL